MSDPKHTVHTDIYRTLNPATGELIREFPMLTDVEAETRLARAHDAFLKWRSTPAGHRAGVLEKIAATIDANRDRIALQISTEMGKPLTQAKFEVGSAMSMFQYYAKHGEALLADTVIEVPGFSRVYARREATGVVIAVKPWNGPFSQPSRTAAPNLMLGNAVLLKPSEITPGVALLLEALLAEAGLPEGLFQVVLASREQIARYIADPRVRAVTLTGSDRAGSTIGEMSGRHIKPMMLELGGSDAFIVLDSADAGAVAATAANCRLALNGQMCISPKRVIVTEKVADAFAATYCDMFARVVIGDPLDPATTFGPLSSHAAMQTLQAQYEDAVDKGATVLVPGGRMRGEGAFFQPAVLTGITKKMRLYSEEAFGPLGIIHSVADADAAIELANDTRYGLGGTVFGQNLAEAERVARALDTGMVGINGYLGAPIEIPFGGTKASGIGRELGASGMDAFANIKTYAIA